MKLIIVLTMAFAIQQIKGQSSSSSAVILTSSPSINISSSYNASKTASTSTDVRPSTQSAYINQTTTSTDIMPIPTSSIYISSSIPPSDNTHGSPEKTDEDMEGKITLYLLIACIGLFFIIIIILIILVLQMKRLTNKLRR